jgi:hypothetical protein
LSGKISQSFYREKRRLGKVGALPSDRILICATYLVTGAFFPEYVATTQLMDLRKSCVSDSV